MAILEVQDIHTYYGDAYVLQGLSLQLEQGQILGLLGRNGVGKTTSVNSIVGFNPPRRGKVIFKGDEITHKASFETVRSGMGLVPQGRRVFPTLGVEENLLVAERSPDRHGWNLQRVYKLFPRRHERRYQRAKTLSGGEQQMLAIGRALMTNPDCLIMDEPSEGLAPIIIQGLWEAIGTLKKEGLSILLVEQNAHLALKLVDFVHVMSKRQVVYSAKPDELRANDAIKSSHPAFNCRTSQVRVVNWPAHRGNWARQQKRALHHGMAWPMIGMNWPVAVGHGGPWCALLCFA